MEILTIIVLLSIFNIAETHSDSVTCNFEKNLCGWKSMKTFSKQFGIVCGLQKHCVYTAFGARNCERMDFYRNHVLWKRRRVGKESGLTDIHGMSVWSTYRTPYIRNEITHVSDLVSDQIPLSFNARCLRYRFTLIGNPTFLVSFTTVDHEFEYLEELSLHKRGWTWVNTGIHRLNRGLVHLPIGRQFKIVLRVIYQWKYYGGSVFVDDIKLSEGPCVDICESDEYKCDNGECINSTNVCNSVPDCADSSDEYNCGVTNENEVVLRSCEPSTFVGLSSNCRSPILVSSFDKSYAIVATQQYCYKVKPAESISKNETLCKNCQSTVSSSCSLNCPETCTCTGLSFKCSSIHVPEVARSIDISGVKVPGNEFKIDNFTFIVHIKLQNCGLKRFKLKHVFRKLQTLDLSDNHITTIDELQISNLVVLKLNNNPLSYPGGLMQRIKNIQLLEVRNASLHTEVLNSRNHKYDIDFSFNNFSTTVLGSDSWDTTLNFSHCQIKNLSQSNIDCHTLDLSFNSIETYFIHRRQKVLFLQNNHLKEFIHAFDTSEVFYVYQIFLQNNEIARLEEEDLHFFPKLIYINLKNNFITEIKDEVFINQLKLVYLDLSYNNIRRLSKKAFRGLMELQFLFLRSNKIKEIDNFVFKYLTKLEFLDLSDNRIISINPYSFAGLVNVKNLTMHNNSFRVQKSMFDGLAALEYLVVDDYTICCARPVTVRKDRCIAPTNDISSCDQLIDVPILAVCIWYMALLAVFGNISVIFYRCMTWTKSRCKTQAIFTINLSIADFMMGVYLYILALTNLYYTGMYGYADFDWRHGATCKVAGVLATLSSESSAIHVFLITLDRLVVIKSAFKRQKISKNASKLLVCCAWSISFSISIVPALEKTYFNSFYSSSGVCISLPLSVIRKPGWQYSMAIFIGFNFIIFLGILIGQIMIFIEVLKSGFNVQNEQTRKREISVAKTLFAVVITDALCWIPVGIIGLITFFGIDVSSQVYAWIVVLVLPLNSALNPILYTFVILLRKKEKLMSQDPGFRNHHLFKTMVPLN